MLIGTIGIMEEFHAFLEGARGGKPYVHNHTSGSLPTRTQMWCHGAGHPNEIGAIEAI